MKSLYLRVWLTVVAVLAAFALASGWLFQHRMAQEREGFRWQAGERLAAWGELVGQALPGASAPPAAQAQALAEWSERLRVPLALDDAQGRRIGASARFEARGEGGAPPPRALPVRLEDGRTLWILRPPRHGHAPPPTVPYRPLPPWLQGPGLVLVLLLLFAGVAAGAYPVVRRLTRRLEALKAGVETFGSGALGHRVDASGRDEVAAVAASFNRAADRIEALLQSNRSLLANASHELRSPLARLKMAVSMLEDAAPERQVALRSEIHRDIAELDALVEEVLLASRLEARPALEQRDFDLHALAAEEAARAGAVLEAGEGACPVRGDERLLRRALRNLLENAHRHGGGEEVRVTLERDGAQVRLQVCDRGPGVAPEFRERIFEPFFRPAGHGEGAGGVGLGLSLVRQIAQAHGGSVRCEPREGGGSCFTMAWPV